MLIKNSCNHSLNAGSWSKGRLTVGPGLVSKVVSYMSSSFHCRPAGHVSLRGTPASSDCPSLPVSLFNKPFCQTEKWRPRTCTCTACQLPIRCRKPALCTNKLIELMLKSRAGPKLSNYKSRVISGT